MPRLNSYDCNNCGYNLPFGFGGWFYAIDSEGNRKQIMHPGERSQVEAILGKATFWNAKNMAETWMQRLGYNSHCLCLDCSNEFDADVVDRNEYSFKGYYIESFGISDARDEMVCPKCKSDNVKPMSELIGGKCPKCHEGTITETLLNIWT